MRQALVAAVIVAACAAAAPVFLERQRAALGAIEPLARDLLRTTFEERRRAVYGYCEPTGYGYLSDVLRAFPEETARPKVRYRDWDQRVELLLPGRRERIEERVLVGVGVSEKDFAPAVIAVAARRDALAEGGASLERLTFQTGRDVEVLRGFLLRFDDPPPAPVALGLTLVESTKNPAVLGSWTIEVPAGQRGDLYHPLPVPLRRFSLNRGATDFVLELRRPAGTAAPAAIAAIGSRLDGEGFAIVAAQGGCLTAARADLLDEIRREPTGPWARFIAGLPGAQPR
jgi:hypothetical protein